MFQGAGVAADDAAQVEAAVEPPFETDTFAVDFGLPWDLVHAAEAPVPESEAARALATLPPQDRAVLLLWDAGMRYAEIADRTRVGIDAVAVTLARARRGLVAAHDGFAAIDSAPSRRVESRLVAIGTLSELELLGLPGSCS